ncbi:hypothetical protein D3C78_1551320 [compost metagenome]
MQVDLPALERPTKAISGTSMVGRWCSCAAVVRKRAVCIQPMASLPSMAGEGLPATGAGEEFVMGGINAWEPHCRIVRFSAP